MRFELLPIIETILELYQKPRNFDRFQDYLSVLQGDTKGDLAVPIGGFNPMAKEHVVEKLLELKAINAEKIIEETIFELNKQNILRGYPNDVFKISITLSDDAKGGWTNRFTTDYDSKFKLNALINRHFCTPVFWTSEVFDPILIRERTLEYAFRTIYWLSKPKPKTLKEHVEQEIFVANQIKYQIKYQSKVEPCDVHFLNNFYQKHVETDDYSIIFNFYYGDNASEQLGFKTYGVSEAMAGFKYVRTVFL
jgi:hypothetical protein